MLCESIESDQKEKEGDLLNCNPIINLNNLIANMDNVFGVQRMCTGERTTDKIIRENRRGKLHCLC